MIWSPEPRTNSSIKPAFAAILANARSRDGATDERAVDVGVHAMRRILSAFTLAAVQIRQRSAASAPNPAERPRMCDALPATAPAVHYGRGRSPHGS